jgi:hypothetical protein
MKATKPSSFRSGRRLRTGSTDAIGVRFIGSVVHINEGLETLN